MGDSPNGSAYVIQNIYVSGTVVAGATGTGAILGVLEGATLQNVMSDATLTSTYNWNGGLVGYSNGGLINNSFSNTKMNVPNNTSGGMIVGDGRAQVNISNNYYNSSLNGSMLGRGTSSLPTGTATALTTAQLSDGTKFPLLSFSSFWAMDPTNPIPQFVATLLPTPFNGVVNIIPSNTTMVYGSTPGLTPSSDPVDMLV